MPAILFFDGDPSNREAIRRLAFCFGDPFVRLLMWRNAVNAAYGDRRAAVEQDDVPGRFVGLVKFLGKSLLLNEYFCSDARRLNGQRVKNFMLHKASVRIAL